MGSEKDKRKHTRLAIKIPAKLTFGNDCAVEGMTHNLSFGGAYIALRDSADAHSGDACQLSLVLQGGPDPIEIQLTCEVVHVIGTGLGIRFLGIDATHYQDFQFLMINNSDDPEKLLEELSHNPGLEIG